MERLVCVLFFLSSLLYSQREIDDRTDMDSSLMSSLNYP